jgi:hypothetical protein
MKAARGTGYHALRAHPALLLLALGCGDHGSRHRRESLAPGVAAQVGAEEVRLATVARIARAQRVSPIEARRRAISDALLAASVRADPAQAARVSSAERSVLARAVLERLRDEAAQLGPPSDAELASLVAQRWPELDRPPSAATAHAVVRVKTPAEDAPAHALVTELAHALAGIQNGDELIQRAQAFPHGALEIVAEHLPPVTPDGRIWDPNEHPPKALEGTLDLAFTRAAVALQKQGEQSGIVKSAFGYHIILLDRRYPELRLSPDEQRTRLTDEVRSRRAKHLLEQLAARLRNATTVSTDRAVDALTALVPLAP